MLSVEITAYLESLIPSRDNIIQEIEAYAQENNVPIMELVGIEAMLQILRLIQPASILEIGTAIGYSAIRMAKALPEANIVSIERDEIRYTKALEYIEMTNTSSQIKVHLGDALELVDRPESLGTSFDVIFIDAAKGQYQRFFNGYENLLSPNGVIITDNVLFKGLVAAEDVDVKRTRSLVNKIRTYNEWLMSNPKYITTILPIGDGIAISKKRGV
ncbi:O-methyltransferase [Bacillus luteolus]|uniref:tRNA 5-hydroxyuridine methyltransferase n=1 Tax=Litchfieldia luteola TaxID=682179 RepID=A0ABR9QHX6_9BACI|nr:O-methyltransferase [Cytobacillus luteolus]MBE4908079.1 O-methyltransferase [Cytobacillus luteolus]MBP1942864.1 putative O-methyltransferase YrrM [Cytobacillus luteolus]